MIVCTKCGSDNPDGTRFCVRCGAYMDWTGVRVAEPAGSAVSAMLKTQDLTVEPGGQMACDVEVHNDGRLVDEYWLQVSGPDASWCSVEPTSLRLMPKTAGSARVLFRPPRAASPLAGTVPFVITVNSTVDPNVKTAVAGSLTIGRFVDVIASMVPQTSESFRVGEHTVKVENRGNGPSRVRVSAQDADDKLASEVVPSDMTVAPGSSASSHVAVWPRNPKEPRAGRRLAFQVLIQPDGSPPIRLDGVTVLLEQQKGWWPKWRLAIAAALLLTLVTAGVALAGPPYPHWPPFPQPSPSLPPSPSPSPVATVANLTVTPQSLKFGTVSVGAGSATMSVTVANSGTGKTNVTAKLSNTKDFSIQDQCRSSSLGPNEKCQLQIAFTPQAEGAMDATLTFTVDNGNTPSPVTLNGFGQGHAILTCVPPSLSFSINISGIVGTPPTSQALPLTCTNSGNGDLNISSVVLQDTTGKFNILSTDCAGKTLKPTTGCAIQTQFATTTAGPTFTASILINSSLGQQVVPVSGWRGGIRVCITCVTFTPVTH